MTGKRAGRRGNGEGSIYQLPDGRWRGSVFLGYRDGKPHRKYVTRRTRTEVASDIRRLLEAHRQGQLITTGGMTVTEWFAIYLEQVAKPKVRPRTYDRYRSDIDRHILPAIGRYRLDKLRPAHLVTLYNVKAAEGLSGASVRHLHAVIRRAMNVAVKWQLLGVNPAALVDSPRVGQHEITPLTADEAQRLIKAARGDRMEARWLVGLALGMRQGEALGLWWDDLDLDAGLLRVRRALQRRHGGGLVFAEPKTAAKQANNPASGATRRCPARPLRPSGAGAYYRRLAVARQSVRVHHADRLARRSSQRLPRVQETARPRRACPRSGCTTSGIQPPACSWPRMSRPRVVMEILGHSQIALTMNTYSHVAPEVSREAARRMAGVLWQDDEDGE